MLPENREELVEDLYFSLKILFLCLIGFSIANDVPDVSSSDLQDTENGKCKYFEESFVCFGTWKLNGFDTGLSVGLYSYQDFDYASVFQKIFFRESDLVDNKSWPNGYSLYEGGNWSGSVPDYNVSVVEGTLE